MYPLKNLNVPQFGNPCAIMIIKSKYDPEVILRYAAADKILT